jgi:hypothetical protein
VLGHHYKDVQWFPLACNLPAEVSSEVLVQNTMGPLFRCVVLRRVHSFTHSFPAKRIPRESTQSTTPIGTPRLDSTTYCARSYPYRLMLYYFQGWSLHEPVIRFGYDDYDRLPESTRHSLELSESIKRSSNLSPQIPILHTNREQHLLIG